ncbi:DNA-binding response regulator [Enterobacter cloacae]|nr:DNA-binding response regulator [Enterobacter cloacae]
MYKVLVVDDHPSIRLVIKLSLNGMEIDDVDECDNGTDAIAMLKRKSYDLLILDIGIPKTDGMAVINNIKKSDLPTRILIFTSQSIDLYGPRCMAAGVSGFVSKNEAIEDLMAAVKAISKGYKYFPELRINTLDRYGKKKSLTNRELDVLRLLASGMSNNEIASQLNLSYKTISTYKTRMMEKLGVTSFAELLNAAEKDNLV